MWQLVRQQITMLLLPVHQVFRITRNEKIVGTVKKPITLIANVNQNLKENFVLNVALQT